MGINDFRRWLEEDEEDEKEESSSNSLSTEQSTESQEGGTFESFKAWLNTAEEDTSYQEKMEESVKPKEVPLGDFPVKEYIKDKEKVGFFKKVGNFVKDITLGKRKEGDKRTDWERFQEEFIGFESKGGKTNREELQQYYDNLKTGKEKVDTAQEVQDLAKLKAYEVLRDQVDRDIERFRLQNEEWDREGTNPTIFGIKRESPETRVKMTDTYVALKKLEKELGMTYVSKGIIPEFLKNIDIGFAKGDAFNEEGYTIATPAITTSTLKKASEASKKLEKDGWDALTEDEQVMAMVDFAVKTDEQSEWDKSLMDKVFGLQGTSLGWGSAMATSAVLSGGGVPDPTSVSTGLLKTLEVAGIQAVRAMNLAPLYTSEIDRKYLDLTTPEYAYFVDKTGDIILEKLQDARYSEEEQGFGVVSEDNKAMQMAKLSNFLEVYSESWGEVLGTGGEEFMNSLIKTKVFGSFANWMRKTGKLAQGTLYGLLKQAKFEGVVGEFLEEELLNPLQSAIERTEYQGIDTKEGRERMLIEFLGFGLTQTGSMIQGYVQNKDKGKAIDFINNNKEKFGLAEDKALDKEGNLYDVDSGEIIVPKEEVMKEPESVFGGVEIDKEEEMLKADIAEAEEGLKAEPVKEVKIQEDEVKTDYSEDAQVQEVLRDISVVLDLGAKKKVISKVEGSESANYGTEDYNITVEGTNIPEFIPEELRSRKYVQKAYDAFLNNTVPQEGTKAWQVYQAILEESKSREGIQMQESDISTVKQQVEQDIAKVTKQKIPTIQEDSVDLEDAKQVWLDSNSSDAFLKATKKIVNAKSVGEILNIIKSQTSSDNGSATYASYAMALDTFYEIKNRKTQKEQVKEGKFALKVEKLRKDAPAYITDLNVSDEAVNIAFDISTGAVIPMTDIPSKLRTEVQKALDAINGEMDKRIAEDTVLQREMEGGFTREELAGYLQMDVLEDRAYEEEMKNMKPVEEDKITDADLPFRDGEGGLLVLNNEKLNKATLEELKSFNRQLFGDENVKIVEQLLTPSGRKALGKYYNAWISLKKGEANIGSTYVHEAGHKAFRMFLTPAERKRILEEVLRDVPKKELLKYWRSKSKDEQYRSITAFVGAGVANLKGRDLSLKYIGTGEGALSLGYGLYATESYDYAEGHAKRFGKIPTVYATDLAINPTMMLRWSNSDQSSFEGDERWGEDRKNKLWEQGVQRSYIAKQLAVKWAKDERVDRRSASGKEIFENKVEEYREIFNRQIDMGGVYNTLSGLLRKDSKDDGRRLASEFLSSIGFDGIMGKERGEWTYVLFKTEKFKNWEQVFSMQETFRGGDMDTNMNVLAEEWLVENIIDYMNNKTSTTFLGKLKRMVEIFLDRLFNGIDHIKDIEDFYESLISGRLLDRQQKFEAKRIKNFNKYLTSIAGAGTKTDAVYRMEVAKEVKKLTTKILKKLEGKTTVKKQFVSDLTKQQDIKQVEKDIINEVLNSFPDVIEVGTFEEKVLAELLPLERIALSTDRYYNIALPDGLRGSNFEYHENIYTSPVEVSAGKIHFNISMGDAFGDDADILNKDSNIAKNYFGHTRVEDIGKDLRRVIEVQSDLYQKGKLELEGNISYTAVTSIEWMRKSGLMSKKELADYEEAKKLQTESRFNKNLTPSDYLPTILQIENLFKKREKENREREVSKLYQYNDPTAHMRMVREEINKAGIDDIKTLLFPTGETGMMIEGLGGQENRWYYEDENRMKWQLFSDKLEAGKQIINNENEVWIIKDILREGEFTAYSARSAEMELENDEVMSDYIQDKGYLKVSSDDIFTWNYKKLFADEKVLDFLRDRAYSEAFDVSGKTNRSNPIYKFYEDTLGKYLKNNYQAESYTDKRGVSWWKVNIKPEYAGAVEAFRLDEAVDYGKVAENLKLDTQDALSIKLPELITMATELGANIKLQKSFRKAGKVGDFTAMEGGTDSRIRILRTLFEPKTETVIDSITGEEMQLPETEEQRRERVNGIEKVLAHEIGHLFDWFGGENNMTLKRGNILGRIANLRGYTEGQFMDLENKEVRKELKTLTQVWNPFDEASVPKKYKTYRYSAKELYAEALSVFLNKPSLVKEVAPNFYQGFVEYLARKSEVKKELFTIMDMIKEGEEIANRIEKTDEGFMEARGRRMNAQERKLAMKREKKWSKEYTWFKSMIQDVHAPYLDKMRKAWKKGGIELSRLEEAKQLMNNLNKASNDVYRYGEHAEREFFNPVREAGIDIDYIGKILMLERNMGDRKDLANPQGLNYDYAKETYDAIKKKLTPAQWELLEEKLKWWREYNFKLVEDGYKAGVYSKSFFKEIATVNRNTYTPFAVVHYINDTYVSAGVIQAVGTLSTIENPIDTQMLKSASLIRLTKTNDAKLHMIKDIKDFFPHEIKKAEPIRDADGRITSFRRDPEWHDKGYRMLELLEDGQKVAYYIDGGMKKAFTGLLNDSQEDVQKIMWVFNSFNRIAKPLFTTLKAGFSLYTNPLKDLSRSTVNLAGLSGLFDWKNRNVVIRTGKVYKAYIQEYINSFKTSWKMATNRMDDVTEHLYDIYLFKRDLKMMDVELSNDLFYYNAIKKRVEFRASLNIFDDIRRKIDENPKLKILNNTIGKLYDGLLTVGMTLERNSKIAGFQVLKRMGASEKEAVYYADKKIGTPAYSTKGHLYPITNDLFIFSNVGTQALFEDAELLVQNPKTRSGAWFAFFLQVGVPVLVQFALSKMAKVLIPDPDDPEKEKEVNPFDYASEYQKATKNLLPIAYDEDSKGWVFAEAPAGSETQVLARAIIWKLLTALSGDGMKVEQVGQMLIGLTPFKTGGNPIVEIVEDWQDYLQGRNPYDDFRGRPAISTAKWNEGGLTRLGNMFLLTGNRIGLLSANTYDKSLDSNLQKVTELPLLERILSVTNYGLTEREEWEKAVGKQEKNKDLEKLLKDYYAEPSNDKLLKKIDEYIVSQKGEEPDGGWTGTDKSEATRLRQEFKREMLERSGDSNFTRISKSGIDNAEKTEILDIQKKRLSEEEYREFLAEVVRMEIVKGEMFATYAKDRNLSQDLVYKVVKESIPVLSQDSNNDLLNELRKRDALNNDVLRKLYDDGLITQAGYQKYIAITKASYDKRYNNDTSTTVKTKLF